MAIANPAPAADNQPDQTSLKEAVMDVGAFEAKTHLPALLKRVAAGERITITRHGQPVAQLGPMDAATPDPHAVIEELRGFAHGCTRGEATARSFIEDGRR
jgi:prevent-host-death family protein